MVSDLEIAKYLQGHIGKERRNRLAAKLEATTIKLDEPKRHTLKTPIGEALADFEGKPILVFNDNEYTQLAGIMMAFDLL